MAKVPTAGGDIDASVLGATLMHEHIFVLSTEINQNYPETWGDEDSRVQDAVRRLQALKSSGIDSLVDMTVLGLRRYIPRIQRIAAQVDLNILVATGIYICDDLPAFFQFRNSYNPSDPPEIMRDMFVKDIQEGIADTGVRAAVLKCATDVRGMTPAAELCFRAAAQAHRITAAPISTHSHAGTRGGLEQQRVFKEEGVDLSRVIIGHSGDTTDLGYLEELIRNGSYLGMDRFGIDPLLSFEKRVDTVARLCAKGYADRMVLSHDAACYMDWFPEDGPMSRLPNWHFLHISSDVLPALKARGVTDSQIRTMMVENPRHIFGS
ncbi:MAG: phosphotriesterase-related protein [Acidobacteria bacterium]|nr:phosphotriesterase-related protein [Acidobacteriota bacterium]